MKGLGLRGLRLRVQDERASLADYMRLRPLSHLVIRNIRREYGETVKTPSISLNNPYSRPLYNPALRS